MTRVGIRAWGCFIGAGLFLASYALSAPAASALGVANPPPPNWVEYNGDEYRDRLETIFHQSNMTLRHVGRAHYRGFGWVGDVDVFQVSAGQTCDEKPCHYIMFSATVGEIPLIQVQISRDHFWINAEQRPAK